MRTLRWMFAALAAATIGAAGLAAQDREDSTAATSVESTKAASSEPDEAPSGRIPLPIETDRYAKSWAVVVGVNYTHRTDAAAFLTPLKTAENDAREVAKTLVDIYGYKAEAAPEQEQTLFLLVGEEATEAKINDALVHLKTAGPNDSVLFYFAGHGVRFSEASVQDRGAIFPSDVVFSREGRPVQHRLRLHSDLLAAVHESQARHRLIILDSCYSGEIFNAAAQPRSEAVNHSSGENLRRRCLQVIASCGDLQVASDGQGSHSPFTQTLLEALKSPPRSEWVTTNELFYFMRLRLESSQNQSPDCRNFQMSGDRTSNDSGGEFRFYVACGEEELSRHRSQGADPLLLQATVAGELGKWWFEVMPWFIPAFRTEILQEHDATRGDVRRMTRDELRRMATRLLDKRGADAGDYRRRHFEMLWEMDRRGQDLKNTLSIIKEDLLRLVGDSPKSTDGRGETSSDVPLADASRRDYTAENLHFLAVVKHRLGDRDTEAAYRRAIKAYQDRRGERDPERIVLHGDHLKALCLADFGEYLYKVARDPREAARRYREADEELGHAGPVPFRVYVKCREADCWLELNRWADADGALKIASDSARLFDRHEPHSLTAYAFSRTGWARMLQWRIQEARAWFIRSNEILRGMMDEGNTAKWTPARDAAPAKPAVAAVGVANETPAGSSAEPAVDRGVSEAPLTTSAVESSPGSMTAIFEVPDYVKRTKDFDSQTLYFHNLHGLAMGLRYSDPEADGAQAAIRYRGLASELEAALARVQSKQAGMQEDAEAGLIDRYVNTLERLGDCNLFANPERRDPEEAADDYRRAEARAHLLLTERRDERRATLLYKRAIALSLPSPGRDAELAAALCQAADVLLGKNANSAPAETLASETRPIPPSRRSAELWTLTQLAPPVVELLNSVAFREVDRAGQAKAAAGLRKAIDEHRRDLGAKLRRDQLETCLLATHVLLEFGGETDRLLLRSDAGLLTDLCRSNLSPYNPEGDARDAGPSESLAYLRPYYDAVFRSRLKVDSRQVHELLELHWEATQGTCYQKPQEPRPVIAVYVLDGRCHLLLDLPHNGGMYVALPNSVDDLRATADFRPIPLPTEFTRALHRWRLERESEQGGTAPASTIECRWEDPLYDVVAHNRKLTETVQSVSLNGAAPSRSVEARRRFPFQLPEGFVEPDPTGAARTAKTP